MAWEKYLRTFSQVKHETTPSCYNGAVFKKWVVFLKRVELYRLDAARKKLFAVWEVLPKLGRSCGVREGASGFGEGNGGFGEGAGRFGERAVASQLPS